MLRILLLGVTSLIFISCGTPEEGKDSIASVIDGKKAATDGEVLYQQYCASCHHELSNTNKPNRTAEGIQKAIEDNAGNEHDGYMGDLKGLIGNSGVVSMKLEKIKSALLREESLSDGDTLYADYCAGCHGALSNSKKTRRTAESIRYANQQVADMNFLSNVLSPAALDAIGSSLASAPLPTIADSDGGVLYTEYCSGCHGPLAQTAKAQRPIASIIYANQNIKEMSFLNAVLSAEAVNSLGISLAAVTPSIAETDGTALYSYYCAGCHGSLSSTTKALRSVASLQSANQNVDAMKFLTPLLSPTALGSVVTSLATITPSFPETDGAGLYRYYCAGCHGTLSVSSKAKRNSASILYASDKIEAMKFLFPLLSATALSAIGTSLDGVTPPDIANSDGAAIYKSYCSGCHGALTNSTKAKRNSNSVQYANQKVAAMAFLQPLLSTGDTTKVAAELAGVTLSSVSESDGPALYQSYCSGCHGELANTAKVQRSVASIQYANEKVGAMTFLSDVKVLSSNAISSIAATLGTISAPNITAGDSLYSAYCAGCHGTLATSTKAKRSAESISYAKTEIEAMKFLSSLLSSNALAALETSLSTTTLPSISETEGTVLYAYYCLGCHNASAKARRTKASIDYATLGINAMNFLSPLLSSKSVTAIADSLANMAPPTIADTDGVGLYAYYCSGCHSDTMIGVTAKEIQSAISINAMRFLNTLSTTQVNAIAGLP
ncbi:hypothetical protein WDW89_22840 [Deltaproteobacteria bacterium TL4]